MNRKRNKEADRERKKRKRQLEKDGRYAVFENEVDRLASAGQDDSNESDVEESNPRFQEGGVLSVPVSPSEEDINANSFQEPDPSVVDSDGSNTSAAGIERDEPKELQDDVWQISKFCYYSSDDETEPDLSSDDDSPDEDDKEYWDLNAFPGLSAGPPVDDGGSFRKSLTDWAITNNITHTALDQLLGLLKENGHESLPKRATTLLGTNHGVSKDVQKLAGGLFWYRGIKNYLESYFDPKMSGVIDGESCVTLDIFVDGLSPYKAPTKKSELWPIAGRIVCRGFKTKPFLIALWCGPKKEPTDLTEFSRQFVEECKELMQGFVLEGVSYKLVLRHIIGDAPARAWLKQVLRHNCKVSCERCDIRGVWFCNRVVFDPDGMGQLRTDESFVNRTDSEYHVGLSPLEEIVKMITQFPLDRLHLVDLGVVRRIFKFLLEPKASSIKLKAALVEKLDWLANELFKFFPSEFRRKPKSISDYRIYKGSEFKRILHYDGIILFSYLSLIAPEYENVKNCFLMLSCAIRILSEETLCHRFVGDARALLASFVSYSASVFGQQFIVYNVHHLRHLADDCHMHGILDGFSAELWESYLGRMKKWLRAPGRTITQVIARTLQREKNSITESYCTDFDKAALVLPQGNGCVGGLSGEMFGKFKCDDFSIVASPRIDVNNCCITKKGDIIIVKNIVKVREKVYFVGRQFVETTSFFDYPIESSLLGIQKVLECHLSIEISHWCVKSDVSKKCVLMPIPSSEEKAFCDGCYLAVPMQHAHHYLD